jgi:hypothetical protein
MHILIIILAILVIPFIIALFMAKDFSIEKDIIINKPQQEVFDYIKILKNSGNYNKWVMTDPNLRKSFTGTDGTVGFVYGWDSDNKQVGKGEQEIKKLTNTRVDYEIRFEKPFKGISTAYIDTASIDTNKTKVTWVFSSDRNYLMCIMHLLLNLKKVLGNDLQTSLVNLKTLLEK